MSDKQKWEGMVRDAKEVRAVGDEYLGPHGRAILYAARRIEELEEAAGVLERYGGVDKLLSAASSALRSYQYGNGDPSLAKAVADVVDSALSAYLSPKVTG